MDYGCDRCTALWQEYTRATHAHIGSESKLEVARLRHDQPAVQRLLPDTQAAAERRQRLRQELNQHEQSAHSGVPPQDEEALERSAGQP
jgi:hypothetical protein